MSERAALAEKLADGHEQERSHLARELHDELAQHLSAVALLSASIKETADAECPKLAPEAQQLFQTTNAAIKSLHATLCTLRPPQTDELELGDSLWTLVKNEEERSGGRLRISLLIGCSLTSFSESSALHVYRIVQEGLTNIAKHTNADWARVSLVRRHEHADQDTVLVLTIENNGCRATRKIDPANRSGFGLGLVGIRERVMALRGQLDITRSAENRFKICAVIPMDPAKGVYNGTG
ncbi:MAG: histidine kinase [Filomicrobium sp.]